MKSAFHNRLLILILIVFIATACKKENSSIPKPSEEQKLPPITQTGAHTFGCILEGEIWLPKHYSNSTVNPPVVLQAFLDKGNGDIFKLNAYQMRKDKNSSMGVINIYTFTNSITDQIQLGDSLWGTGAIYEYEAFKNGTYAVYKSIINQYSWIQFSRFDTINHIAAGSFSIDLVNMDDHTDTVRIRDGRFDVRF